MNETLFYVFGIALAISAVATSVIGLKVETFPGKAMPLVIVWFAILIAGAGTFAVLHGKDEDKDHAVEYKKAGEEIEEEQTSGPFSAEGASGGETEEDESNTESEGEVAEEAEETEESEGAGESGGSTTLKLEASETELMFNTKALEAEAGKVTIDLNNPSSIPHNVAIAQEGQEIAVSETEAGGETSVTANLEPGTYTFLCTVPGHAEAGMEGTLTVK